MASREKSSELKQYDELVMERYWAMCASQSFQRIRGSWLRFLHKRKPFRSTGEWVEAQNRLQREEPESWTDLQQDVAGLSELYGIAP